MDRQAWIAIILVVAGLFAWQIYVAKHAPPPSLQTATTPAASISATSSPGAVEPAPSAAPGPSPNESTPTPTPKPFVEQTATLKNSDLVMLLTNRGGGVAEAVLPKHKDANGQPLKLNARQRVPIGALIDQPATPVLEEFSILSGEGNVQFERALPNDVSLRKKFTLPNPPNEKDNYVAQLEVAFQNRGARPFNQPDYYVALGSAAPIHRNDLPNYTRVTWCIDGKTRNNDVSWFAEQTYPIVGGVKRPAQQFFEEKISNAEWLGVSNQFFATLITPLGTKATGVWARRFEAHHSEDGKIDYGIDGAMGMPGFAVQPGQTATVQFQLYIGPKLYHRLAQLTHDEAEIMDFGLWKLICQALLNAMNLIHSVVGNYAIAILILTAIVRLALWPVQTKSMKSMRQMQVLGPKMQELKEKYKDDPTRMNAEVMKLYKAYGVNPVSGCLPMFIQIPIFFGLFTMLRQAVELRNASFLWVHDLSQPDTLFTIPGLGWIPILGAPGLGLPINILPILMALTQIWLMRLTPKSGDAMQQRMLMFMPIIFVLFCYNFAAALSLYYTTQNLFMILQSYQNRKQPLPKLEKVTQPAKRKGNRR